MSHTTSSDLTHPRSPRAVARLLASGYAMGAADLVPGVSGGTMAFVLGIYEALLDAIVSVDARAVGLAARFKLGDLARKVPFGFIFSLGSGILLALVTLAGTLSAILDDDTGRIYLFAFFFGLVVASIIAVGSKVRWSAKTGLAFVAGTVVALIVVNLVPAEADHTTATLVASGALAITAMILPGISGSFVLLILGQYDYVLEAVANRDIGPLLAVAAGAVIGLAAFSRILRALLRRAHNVTVAVLVGFMAGSLWRIWPWRSCLSSDVDRHGLVRCVQETNVLPSGNLRQVLLAALLAIAGLAVVSLIDHAESRRNPVVQWLVPRASRSSAR